MTQSPSRLVRSVAASMKDSIAFFLSSALCFASSVAAASCPVDSFVYVDAYETMAPSRTKVLLSCCCVKATLGQCTSHSSLVRVSEEIL